MTAMLPHAPDDVEELVVVWLTPLGDTAITRRTGDPLPFRLVRTLGGEECKDEETADFVVTVRTICDKNLGEAAAAAESVLTHRRILELGRYLSDVPLSSGRNASIDYLDVFESPVWVNYSDEHLCKLARYKIGLSYA
jgi:hypothetical protein